MKHTSQFILRLAELAETEYDFPEDIKSSPADKAFLRLILEALRPAMGLEASKKIDQWIAEFPLTDEEILTIMRRKEQFEEFGRRVDRALKVIE